MNKSARKMYLSVLVTLLAFVARAQTIIEPQIPSQGIIQQGQLWNVLIINNGQPLLGYVLELSFQEEGTDHKIFTGVSGPLSLQAGVSQLTSREIGAVQYQYFSAVGSAIANSGLLPIGRFAVCYSLLPAGMKSVLAVSQDCIPVTVEPFAPPQLAYPTDKSEVTTDYPVFNWLPPMPANMFTDLRYKLVLTEIKKGQSPEDAIQRNPILFFQEGLKDPALPYPSSYVALQGGKNYAWQVVASNENTYSASTEIWSFNLRKDSFWIALDNASYPHLQRGVGSNHFIVHEKIKFSYDNEAGDSALAINIYGYNDRGKMSLVNKTVVAQRGLNFIDFDLGNDPHMQRGNEYVLEIVNGWKENWDVKFRYEPLNQ